MKQVWNKDIDVYFQSKAWTDTQFCVDWFNHTLKPLASKESYFTLFCDNLGRQISDRFKEAVSDIGGIIWYSLPNATDLWQPVDAEYAKTIKIKIKQAFFNWLGDDDHVELWYAESSQLKTSDKRILITG